MKASANAAQLVRSLRQQLGLTQEKLAARLGVAFPTINRWENGHSHPSPLALRQIESLLSQVGGSSLPSEPAPVLCAPPRADPSTLHPPSDPAPC